MSDRETVELGEVTPHEAAMVLAGLKMAARACSSAIARGDLGALEDKRVVVALFEKLLMAVVR